MLLVFDKERYQEDRRAYLNVFRYFAKLLCCQAAAAQAPIPRRVSAFAIDQSDHNPIFLTIKRDWRHEQIENVISSCDYASHGGFTIFGDSQKLYRLNSSVTVGSLQYVFWMRIERIENLELKYLHSRFYKRCQEVIKSTDKATAEANERLLGFTT